MCKIDKLNIVRIYVGSDLSSAPPSYIRALKVIFKSPAAQLITMVYVKRAVELMNEIDS